MSDPPCSPRAGGARVSRAWAARVLLVGMALLAWQLVPALPRDQDVALVLKKDDSIRVRRIDVSWKQSNDDEVLGVVTLNFPNGAPPVVHETMSLPNGQYLLTVRIEAVTADSKEKRVTTQTRNVTLEGGSIRVFLKDPSS